MVLVTKKRNFTPLKIDNRKNKIMEDNKNENYELEKTTYCKN